MEFAYNLGSNSTPLIKKYQVGETFAQAGVICAVSGTGNYGVRKATTTAAANSMGLALDVVTTLTAQQADNSDPARMISVIINPDAVLRSRLSGGATDGTAITDYAETSGNTAGTTVTAAGLVSADEGMIVCSAGANAGKYRKNITGGSGSAVAGVAFPLDIAIGDRFFTLPVSCMDIQTVQLTTNVTEVNATAAVATNQVPYQAIEIQLGNPPNEILTQSYVFLVAADHLFASN